MKTAEAIQTQVAGKKVFLPEHYTEAKEPFFQGKGEHSVSQLEEICDGYKEYAHQADIAFYSCSRRLSVAQEENNRLREALAEAREHVRPSMFPKLRKKINALLKNEQKEETR